MALPRSDHAGFMGEREFASSDFQFFWRSLFYNQTRVLDRGDFFLFRPAMTGLLAIMDILFRKNLFLMGAVSILMHGLVAFSLYLVLTTLVSRVSSLFLAGMLLTFAPGLEMVFWRHISPYLLSFFFLNLAFLEIKNFLESNQPMCSGITASLWFLLSASFHEATWAMLLVSGTLFLMTEIAEGEWTRGAQSISKTLKLSQICLIPVGLLFAAKVIAVFFYRVPLLFDLAGNSAVRFQWNQVITTPVFVSGLLFAPSVLPGTVQISFPNLEYRGMWDFTRTSPALFYSFGCVFLLLLALFSIYAVGHWRKNRKSFDSVLPIFVAVYLAVIVGGLAGARALPRTVNYLQNSSYYLYFIQYAMLLAVTLTAVHFSKKWLCSDAIRKYAAGICWTVMVFYIGFGARSIQTTLKPRASFDERAAKLTLTIAETIQDHPGYCYGGSTSLTLTRYVQRGLLYDESCDRRARELDTPLYALDREKTDVWFYVLKRPERPFHIQYGFPGNGSTLELSDSPNSGFVMGNGFMLTEFAHDPIDFAARIHDNFVGGLVTGYRDFGNHLMLVANQRYFYVHETTDGIHSPPKFVSAQVLNNREFLMSIRQVGDRYYTFYNRTLMAEFEGVASLAGKLGLYSKNESGKPNRFSDVTLVDRALNPNLTFIFEPVFRLNLSDISLE